MRPNELLGGRRVAALCLMLIMATPAFAGLAAADRHQEPSRCEVLQTPKTGRLDTHTFQDLPLWDYGDAPDDTAGPYPTFYSAGGAPIGEFPTVSYTGNSAFGTSGARHREVRIGWLGNILAYGGAPVSPLLLGPDQPPSREIDADAFPDQDLVITNLDPATLTPDHDFRDDSIIGATLPAWGVGSMNVQVSSIPGFQNWYLNILFDWNYDGQWVGGDPLNGAPEWAVVNEVVSVPAMTSILVTTTPFLVGSTPGTPWLRITLSDTPVPVGFYPLGWDGSVPPGTFDANGFDAFECGETEDYCGPVSVAAKGQGGSDPRDPTQPSNPDEGHAVVCFEDHHQDPCFGVVSSAKMTNIYAGSVNGQAGTVAWTGNPGLGFRSGAVSANGGLDVDIAYQCTVSVTLDVYKVFSPPGTNPTGPLYSQTWNTGCGTGSFTQKVPVYFDWGEYDFVLSYTGCDSTTGSQTERVIIYDPPIL